MGYIHGLGVGFDKVAVMPYTQRNDNTRRYRLCGLFLCDRSVPDRGRNCRYGRSGFDKGIVCIQSHGKFGVRLKRWVHGCREFEVEHSDSKGCTI